MTSQLDRAYRDARDAMRDCLNDGCVDSAGLAAMRAGLASMAPNQTAFGVQRYDELRALFEAVEQLPVREPVLVRQEPMFGPEHARQMRPYRWVPYPYRLGKMDPAWLFVLFLAAGGFAFKPLWLLAGFITFMRCLIWCAHRFPMTTIFFVSFFGSLFGGGRRGRR